MNKVIQLFSLLLVISGNVMLGMEKELEKNEIPSLKILSRDAIVDDLINGIKACSSLEDFKNIYTEIDQIFSDNTIKNILKTTKSSFANALKDYTTQKMPALEFYLNTIRNNNKFSDQSLYHIYIGLLAVQQAVSAPYSESAPEDIYSFMCTFISGNNPDEAIVMQELLTLTIKSLLQEANTINDYQNIKYIQLVTCASQLFVKFKELDLEYCNVNYKEYKHDLFTLVHNLIKFQSKSASRNIKSENDDTAIEILDKEFSNVLNTLNILEQMIPENEYINTLSDLNENPRVRYLELPKNYKKISDIIAVSILNKMYAKYISHPWTNHEQQVRYDIINKIKCASFTTNLSTDLYTLAIEKIDRTAGYHANDIRNNKIWKKFSSFANEKSWFGISFATGSAFLLSALKIPAFVASQLSTYPAILRYGVSAATVPLVWYGLAKVYDKVLWATRGHSSSGMDIRNIGDNAVKGIVQISGLVLGAALTSGALGMYTYFNNKK